MSLSTSLLHFVEVGVNWTPESSVIFVSSVTLIFTFLSSFPTSVSYTHLDVYKRQRVCVCVCVVGQITMSVSVTISEIYSHSSLYLLT